MTPRIGSLFSGYGGLDLAVEAVTGGRTVWVSDVDPGANRILAHRRPDTPNHGDLTRIDWASVEPIDVLTGGFPCQDLSHAGKRAGLKPGTRSGLWSHMAYAINQLRPSLVVFENVRGLLSARAASDLEPCPWCVGDDEGDALRALGSVLGDLAVLGYDCAWVGLRAADVGAPHGRFRVFGVAWPAADTGGPGLEGRRAGADESQQPEPVGAAATTTDTEDNGRERGVARGQQNRRALAAVGGDPKAGAPFPTPRATDGTAWGQYAAAIARWEHLTRPAPAPTMTSAKATPQLSPAFSEWLMGLPAGHVTDVPGLSRAQMLKALGNGVVPQQAAAALQHLLPLIPRGG